MQMTFHSINPATEEVIATYEEFTEQQLEHALERAAGTYRRWRRTSLTERSELMRNISPYRRVHVAVWWSPRLALGTRQGITLFAEPALRPTVVGYPPDLRLQLVRIR